MTDGDVFVLQTSLAGRVNDVEIEVACDPVAGTVRYALSGFDKQRQGAVVETEFQGGEAHHPLTLRKDDRPVRHITTPSRFSNQVTMPYPTVLIDAKRLVVGIPFQNSDETYVIDQTSATFRNAVGRCRQLVAQAEQAKRDQAAAQIQQQQQQDAQPIQVQPQQPSSAARPPAPADDGEGTTWNSVTNQ